MTGHEEIVLEWMAVNEEDRRTKLGLPRRDDPIARPKPRAAPVGPRRFEAWTDCPKCGRFGVHYLRAPCTDPVPDIPPERSGYALWESLFANMVMAPLETEPQMKPNPEAQFEVIRTCTNCSHEWGET